MDAGLIAPHANATRGTKILVYHISVAFWALPENRDSVRHARLVVKYLKEKGVAYEDFAKYELSHLCHNKKCFNPNHIYPEPNRVNSSRDHCEVVIFVNGELRDICRHNPKCLRTKKVLDKAFKL
jgi:hypothetical protein